MTTELPLRGTSGGRVRVAVVGSGFAAAEAAIALHRLAGDRVAIDLVSARPELTLRPLAIPAVFGMEDVQRAALADLCSDHDASLHEATVTFVDVARRRLETDRGTPIPFDAALLAPGARTHVGVPGALGFDGMRGVRELRALMDRALSGPLGTVVFAVPKGVAWTLPVYELALLTAARAGGAARVRVVTPERAPLEQFGDAASTRTAALLAEKGIAVSCETEPQRVVPAGLQTNRGLVGAAHVIALPVPTGPRMPGVVCDADGFIPVDRHMRVDGTANVYAAGDAIAFAVKQGGLATQQAEVAATEIAARAGAPVTQRPFEPVLRAMLLTGSIPLYLRGEGPGGAGASAAPLWRPAGKVAARHLAPWLDDRLRERLGTATPFTDLPASREEPADHDDRVALALLFADDEAEAGDAGRALEWLSAVEAIDGLLPPEYVEKRRRWTLGSLADTG